MRSDVSDTTDFILSKIILFSSEILGFGKFTKLSETFSPTEETETVTEIWEEIQKMQVTMIRLGS